MAKVILSEICATPDNELEIWSAISLSRSVLSSRPQLKYSVRKSLVPEPRNNKSAIYPRHRLGPPTAAGSTSAVQEGNEWLQCSAPPARVQGLPQLDGVNMPPNNSCTFHPRTQSGTGALNPLSYNATIAPEPYTLQIQHPMLMGIWYACRVAL